MSTSPSVLLTLHTRRALRERMPTKQDQQVWKECAVRLHMSNDVANTVLLRIAQRYSYQIRAPSSSSSSSYTSLPRMPWENTTPQSPSWSALAPVPSRHTYQHTTQLPDPNDAALQDILQNVEYKKRIRYREEREECAKRARASFYEWKGEEGSSVLNQRQVCRQHESM